MVNKLLKDLVENGVVAIFGQKWTLLKQLQILHVGLFACVKHCPFFSLVFASLLRYNECKKLNHEVGVGKLLGNPDKMLWWRGGYLQWTSIPLIRGSSNTPNFEMAMEMETRMNWKPEK